MLVSRSRRAGTASGSSAARARGARGSGRPRARRGTLRCRACGRPPRPQPGSHGGGAGPAALLRLGSLLPCPCEGRLLLCACCWSRAGVRGPAAGRQRPAGAMLGLGTRRSSCPSARVWIMLLHQEQEGDGWSGSSCAVTPNAWQEVFRSAGSSVGLGGRQRQEGLVWVRLW